MSHPHTPQRNIHFIVQFLNTWSLQWHYVDMTKDCNLQSSHILCRNETCIKLGRDSKDWSQLINVRTFEILVCCDEHSPMMVCETSMVLFYHEMYTHNNVKFAVVCNLNTWKTVHVIAMYKPTTMHLDKFNHTSNKFHLNPSCSCPIIFICGFHMDMFNVSPWSKKSETYMRHYNLELVFSKSLTTYDSQIDNTWSSC